MLNYFAIKKTDFNLLLASILIALFAFAGLYASYAGAEAVTLGVTVQSAITFSTSTNDFSTITPGTWEFATTTLSVVTNDADGWNVTLYGDNQGSIAASTTMYRDTPDYDTGIIDDTEWVPDSATSSPGNATSLTLGDDVLAFRVMTASSTNGGMFISTDWWGEDDGAGAEWAGIASSTVQRKIGDTNVISGGTAVNTVLYYLDVPGSQELGAYTGPLTYTATAN